ncbi:MAG: ABC transporter permease [Actinobacteria bacterium]|nr:ABC transporter permease [Actinomycetota bacterium]
MKKPYTTQYSNKNIFLKIWKFFYNLEWNKKILYATLIFIIALFSLLNIRFLSVTNLINIVEQVAIVTIIAVGSTFAIISGEIDLSVGSVVGLSAMTSALMIKAGGGLLGGLLAGLITGAVVGLINGLITTKAKVPSFLVTIGMMGMIRGLGMTITATRPVPITLTSFNTIFGGGNLLGIRATILWMVLILILGHVVLSLTPFGQYVYATGGNRIAASYTGINTDRIKTYTLILSGLMAGFAGVLYAARFAAARGTFGDGMELGVIAAIILGGTSLFGGKGTILGTFQGAIVIGALTNGLLIIGLDPWWQMGIRGFVIVFAVAIGGGWYKNTKM